VTFAAEVGVVDLGTTGQTFGGITLKVSVISD
jgi:hypothetical protein